MPQETFFLAREIAHPLGRLQVAMTLRDGLGVLVESPFRAYGAYAAVLIERGHGIYWDAEGVEAEVQTGTVIFVLPGRLHRYRPDPGTTWDERFVVFDGPLFDTWRAQGAFPDPPLVNLSDARKWGERMVECVRPMVDSLANLVAWQQWLADALAEGAAERLHLARDESSRPVWCQRACERLIRDLAEPFDMVQLAESLGMAHETFRKRFTQEMAATPTQYREWARVQAAAQLLRYTNLTHQAIAIRVGYRTEPYFSRRFRQATGHAPREFRRRAREQAHL